MVGVAHARIRFDDEYWEPEERPPTAPPPQQPPPHEPPPRPFYGGAAPPPTQASRPGQRVAPAIAKAGGKATRPASGRPFR